MDCGATTIKYLLFMFNFLFFISGIAVLTIGSIVKAKEPDYAYIGKDVFGVSILLIVVGLLVAAIAFLGCCGAVRESRCMLYSFAGLLCLIFVMEFAGGIAAFVYKDALTAEAEKSLNSSIYEYTNSTGDVVKKQWDEMQSQLKCCGTFNYTDWKNVLKNDSVPISCCLKEEAKCGDGKVSMVNATGIYTTGCVDQIVDYVKSQAMLIGGIGIGIAFIQILGIVFACCLASALKN